MQLRPYQADMVEEARAKLRKVRRVLIQCPTGGGKTAIAAFIAKSTVERGGEFWFNCHRDFLLDQTAATFRDVGLDSSFIAAGRWFNPWTPVHINMIGTLRNRIKKGTLRPPRVCCWDEAHHIS